MKPWRVVAILALSSLLGGLWNAFSGRGIAVGRSVFAEAGDELISAEVAKQRLDDGALFLDARPRAFWEMNRIPGALSLPEDDFEAAFEELEPELRRRFDVVVYCSGYGCEASHLVARQLRERGIPAVVLDEGLPAWEDAGYPLEELS
jgi:rhodanese-related sulfurtransferase